jgi:hypothetical protein
LPPLQYEREREVASQKLRNRGSPPSIGSSTPSVVRAKPRIPRGRASPSKSAIPSRGRSRWMVLPCSRNWRGQFANT